MDSRIPSDAAPGVSHPFSAFFLTHLAVFSRDFFFIHMGVLPACVSVRHTLPGSHRGQKRVLDLLGLELQRLVNFHIGARNRIWTL